MVFDFKVYYRKVAVRRFHIGQADDRRRSISPDQAGQLGSVRFSLGGQEQSRLLPWPPCGNQTLQLAANVVHDAGPVASLWLPEEPH